MFSFHTLNYHIMHKLIMLPYQMFIGGLKNTKESEIFATFWNGLQFCLVGFSIGLRKNVCITCCLYAFLGYFLYNLQEFKLLYYSKLPQIPESYGRSSTTVGYCLPNQNQKQAIKVCI